ncbi:MAG: hypothetical protein ABIN91_11215 [Mucilaginibacter sp.]|uniref:hypothetical protein n=1 Tax=Mucilaginibacter sp. TaxID=1882438 RepID=UPI003266FD87
MGYIVDLVDKGVQVNSTLDSIVIIKNDFCIPGGKSLDVTGYFGDVLQAGHVIIKETATGNYKPMPATDLSPAGVATIGSITSGAGYTNGVYENVPLSGGAGRDVLANVTVAGAVVTVVTITKVGRYYTVGDVLSIPAAYAGGTGAGASVPVATIADGAAAYGSLPTGHTYAGILVASILAKRPFAGVMLEGWVNENASPFPVASIKAAFQTATSNLIQFRGDLS